MPQCLQWCKGTQVLSLRNLPNQNHKPPPEAATQVPPIHTGALIPVPSSSLCNSHCPNTKHPYPILKG
jgi:hypothetical protein